MSKDEVVSDASVTTYVYMLRCRDGRYYIGSTRGSLERRINAHNAGAYGGFTKARRPVRLVYHQAFANVDHAVAAERPLKGWSRAKKEALISGDFDTLHSLAKRGSKKSSSSFDTRASLAAQDEEDKGLG